MRFGRTISTLLAALLLATATAGAAVPDKPVVLTGEMGGDMELIRYGDGFFGVWRSDTPTGHATLQGRRFSRTGRPIGAAFAIEPRRQSQHDLGGVVLVPVSATDVAVFWHGMGRFFTVSLNAAIVRPSTATVLRTTDLVPVDDRHLAATKGADGTISVAYTDVEAVPLPAREIIRVIRLKADLTVLPGGAGLNGAAGEQQDGFVNTDFALIDRQGGTLGLHLRRRGTYPVALMAHRLGAGGKPVGAPIKINTTTMANVASFYYTPFEASMARLADGRIVVTWPSLERTTTSSFDRWEIRARILSATGIPAGPDFLVNTVRAGMQIAPEVQPLANGGFVIAWVSKGANGAVAYQHRGFDRKGKPLYAPRTSRSGMSPALLDTMNTVRLKDGSLAIVHNVLGAGTAYGIANVSR